MTSDLSTDYNRSTNNNDRYLENFLHLITELGSEFTSLIRDKLENALNDLGESRNEIIVDIGAVNKENAVICNEALVKVAHFLLPLSDFN